MITEALLEMHFFRPLVNLFKTTFGAKVNRLIKPSPSGEAWVGFDQGWASTTLTTEQLFEELKKGVQNKSGAVAGFYLGYFLQFKVVERRIKGSRYKPLQYSVPYFRSELSLKPNQTTGLSQHETLQRLARIQNACVSYACPMVFDIADIWQQPDLSKFRVVDISNCPNGWQSYERHFIVFKTSNDPNPIWHSEPVTTRSLSPKEWLSPDSRHRPKTMSGEELLRFIIEGAQVIREAMTLKKVMLPHHLDKRVASLLPSSFTIIEMS